VTPEELKEWQSAKNEPENEAPFKSGDIVKVLIGKEDKNLLSDEGEMQDDWRVIGINNDGTISVKWKGKLGLPKDVSLEDLKKWNNIKDKPIVPEKTEDPEEEKRKEKTRKERQEKTEKIKAELELARKDYAEIRHKKLKAWNDLGNHFGKEYVQKEFDKDSEVLLMKKAYQDKLTEYKNALILGISEGFIRQEEIIDMMLDEINKMYDADIDVRKKNNETFFSYANYHKIFSPEKETDIHQENISFHADNLMIKEVDNLILNELDKLEPGENHDDAVKLIRSDAVKEYAYSHGMTIDEAMKKLSKDNNGTKFSITHDSAGLLHAHFNEKIVTKDDGMPENAVVQQDSKNNVKSELQELIKAKFKNINDTKETAINIKDSIFGKSDNIFSVWKGENVTEIIKSKESRKDFLEKIPKTGKTFFNELIKQVPPESGDTMRRWIARVAIEAKKQKE
jgi:hypothetical protein